MEPAGNASNPQQRSLAFGEESGHAQPKTPRSVGTDPRPADGRDGSSETDLEQIPPVWLQRLGLVTEVAFALYLGLLLIVLPWKGTAWTGNSLLADFPGIRAVFNSFFFRGVVTGLGLIDVWIGISTAVRYREKRPAQR